MAARPKRRVQKPERLIDVWGAGEDFLGSTRPKKQKKDNKLYEVEVTGVDREKRLVRIHYKGYDKKYDEWRPYGNDEEYFPFIRQEKPHTLTTDSVDDRVRHFIDLLYREVKRNLYSRRKCDPNVRLEIHAMEDVFDKVLGNVVECLSERGKKVHNVATNRALDVVLGPRWDERIVNYRGDYCYIAEGTVKYWHSKKASITEFKTVGGKYVRTEIEGCGVVVVTFVRGTGNRLQYEQRA